MKRSVRVVTLAMLGVLTAGVLMTGSAGAHSKHHWWQVNKQKTQTNQYQKGPNYHIQNGKQVFNTPEYNKQNGKPQYGTSNVKNTPSHQHWWNRN